MAENMRRSSSGRNMVSVAVANVAIPAAAFAAAPILAHGLGVVGRGEVAAATSLLLLLTAVGSIGLPEAVAYFVASRPGLGTRVVRHAFWLLGLTGGVSTLISFWLAPLLARHDEQLTALFAIASIATLPTMVLGAVRGLAQGQHEWSLVNAEKYVTAFTRLSALIGLAVSGHLTPASAIAVMVVSPILGGTVYLRLFWAPTTRLAGPVGPLRLLTYSSKIWLGALSGILLTRVSQVIMTPLAGAYELGLYAVAVNVADIVLITNAAIRDVIFSADARDQDDGKAYRAARISLITSLLIAVGLGSTLFVWLPAVFGDAFLPAAPATLVLILATVAGVPGSIGGAVLSARGKPGLRSVALTISMLVNVALLLLLVGPLGAIGASVAILVGNLVAGNLNLIFLRRHFGMRIREFYVIRPGDLQTIASVARSLFRRKQ